MYLFPKLGAPPLQHIPGGGEGLRLFGSRLQTSARACETGGCGGPEGGTGRPLCGGEGVGESDWVQPRKRKDPGPELEPLKDPHEMLLVWPVALSACGVLKTSKA